MNGIKDLHANIEAVFGKMEDVKSTDVLERLVGYAKRGLESPESLSLLEIKQICYALILYSMPKGIE